ncbi:MAG: hypothetical protein IJO77_05690 [Oscillospiraceae bacterium]|nr:hypothetical protein [Oscillospiraceae bacterium]
MNENEKKILETIGEIVPNLSKDDKIFLLGYVEGIGAAASNRKSAVPEAEKTTAE